MQKISTAVVGIGGIITGIIGGIIYCNIQYSQKKKRDELSRNALCMIALDAGNKLHTIPCDLRTETVCLYAISKDVNAFGGMYLSKITYKMCEIRASQGILQFIPSKFIDKNICKLFAEAKKDNRIINWYGYEEYKLSENQIDDIINACNEAKKEVTLEMFRNNVLSGKQFNKLKGKYEFIKLTNEKENHNGFQFVDGINEDTNTFDTSYPCSKGGIYFCYKHNVQQWTNNDVEMKYVRYVTIPDDAKVYYENDKFKTNKLVLGSRQNLADIINEVVTAFI
jgi:hypothetical protein